MNHTPYTPYNRVVKFTCVINAESDVGVQFLPELEATFDCIVCKRIDRTVVFHPDEQWPKCTASGKFPSPSDSFHPSCNGFCGELTSFTQSAEGTRFVAEYVVHFAYLPFRDYKRSSNSTGVVDWGRPHIRVTCSSCGESRDTSIQSYLGRPYTKHCDCGAPLFTEVDEMPVIENSVTA